MTLCVVCRGPDGGMGYVPNAKRHKPIKPGEITWVCNDHLHLAKGVNLMAKPIFNQITEDALRRGGDAAGAYLDKIGKTDLATLTEEEWLTMLVTFEEGRGAAMVEMLEASAAPF